MILDGTFGQWSPYHARPRYKCLRIENGQTLTHVFAIPLGARHPTHQHPTAAAVCPDCESQLEPHEGPRGGVDFLFVLREITNVLLDVGDGKSLREAAKRTRLGAQRSKPDPNSAAAQRRRAKRLAAGKAVRPPKTNRTHYEDDYSRDGRIVANYLDAFGPIVLAEFAPKSWPRWVAIDSQPLRARKLVLNDAADGAKRARGGGEAGEVMVAIDCSPGHPARPLMLGIEGGKDSESWKHFLRRLPGPPPEFVVADRGPEIDKAVRDEWPGTTQYSCEGHLLRNAQDAAVKDGLPQWIPNPDLVAQAVKVDQPAWVRRSAGVNQFTTHPIWRALDSAQWNEKHWRAFVELVEAEAAAAERGERGHSPCLALRKWIADTEPLILAQAAYRDEQRDGRPRSTGSAEAITRRVRAAFEGRAGRFKNARRLDIILGLIRLSALGEANRDRYLAILRRHFESNGGSAGVNWEAGLDKFGSSIDALIDAADARLADAQGGERRRGDSDRYLRRIEEAEAERAEAGLTVLPPAERKKHGRRRVGGMVVADFPELLAQWHSTRNGELDPHKLGAGARGDIEWLCRAHEAAGHVHEWRTELKARTMRGNRCPFCLGLRVCPSNSLAALFPDMAADWHPTKNGAVRPDQVTAVASTKHWWVCPHGHDDYLRPVWERTREHRGCPDCGRKSGQDKARERGPAVLRARRASMIAPKPVVDPAVLDDEPF